MMCSAIRPARLDALVAAFFAACVLCSACSTRSVWDESGIRYSPIGRPVDRPLTRLDSGDYLLAPFEMDISLSEAAEKAIRNGNETIVLLYAIYGDPWTEKTASNEKYFSDGYGFAGRIELARERSYRFDSIVIPGDFYDAMAKKTLLININVITGRKSSANNLISCDVLAGDLREMCGKRFYIKGKLIRE